VVQYVIIKFVLYYYLSIFAPIFFHVEGEVSIPKKVTILIKAKEASPPLSQACITHLLPAPLSLSGPTIWYQHSLTKKIRVCLN